MHLTRDLRGQALALDRVHHVSFDRGPRELLKAARSHVQPSHHSLADSRTACLPSAGMDSFGSQVGVLRST